MVSSPVTGLNQELDLSYLPNGIYFIILEQ
ncbi:MAG: hypothetical protein K1X61_07790 [Chitinophagales bacterium]|nr:hypothetical protein [Chitinophagales bacterium]